MSNQQFEASKTSSQMVAAAVARRGVRRVGHKPSRFAVLISMCLRMFPFSRRRSRLQSRLEQVQRLRRIERAKEDAA